MKYQVQIQYTNPSHEHVSLRRRVESVTRLVEAANEQEAVNRATRQQRALGFMIKEAKATAVQKTVTKIDFGKFGKDILAQRLEEKFDVDQKVEPICERNVENKIKKDNAVRRVGAHALIKHGIDAGSPKMTGRKVMKSAKFSSGKVSDMYRKLPSFKEETEIVDEGIAADTLAAKREKKQKVVRNKILDQELQDRRVTRGKARQAGTIGHPAKADRFEKLKNEEKANVNNPKKAKINIALNKMKKNINLLPTLQPEKNDVKI
jgi:hypothetical protein